MSHPFFGWKPHRLIAFALAAGLAFILFAAGRAMGWDGPLLLGAGSADFGQIPEPRAATEAALRAGGTLLVDRPDFYGALAASTMLRGRVRFRSRWFASGAVEALSWRYAANAVVTSNAARVGPATLGLHREFVRPDGSVGPPGSLAPFLRVLLPFDGARRYGRLWGAEVGASGLLHLGPRWALRGGLTLPTTLALVSSTGHAAFGAAAVAEAAWAPLAWLDLSAGLGLRSRLFPAPASESRLHALAARVSAQLVFRSAFWLAVGAEAPLAGAERTDLAAALFAGWRPLRSLSLDSR